MLNSLKELFKTNKVNAILLVIDAVVIVCMTVLLIIHKLPVKDKEAVIHSEKEPTNAEENAAAYQTINECLLESYGEILRGSTFTSGEKIFEFGDENSYNGYVSEEYPNVTDWIYSLDISSDECILKLYNNDYTAFMYYIIDITEESKVMIINQLDPDDTIVFD